MGGVRAYDNKRKKKNKTRRERKKRDRMLLECQDTFSHFLRFQSMVKTHRKTKETKF